MVRPITTCLLVSAICGAILGITLVVAVSIPLAMLYQFLMDGFDNGLG
jgi:hypothetical protein